jgi:hypothetical protein
MSRDSDRETGREQEGKKAIYLVNVPKEPGYPRVRSSDTVLPTTERMKRTLELTPHLNCAMVKEGSTQRNSSA